MAMRRFPASRLMVALAWAGAMVASSTSIAEIYKWVDQKGVTNYSSSPPANGKARTVDPGTVTVSVYPAPPPEETARALDAMMRHRVAMLESQLRAERLARLQASYQTDADRYRLAYEQCLRERRVDCDHDGMRATPYFYAVATPFAVARPFTPITPFMRTPPFGAGFPQPTVGSMRTANRGLSGKGR